MKSETGKILLLFKRQPEYKIKTSCRKSLRWGLKGRDAIGGSVPAKLFIMECVI